MMDRPAPYPGIEDTLSIERFATYLAWASGDRDRAVDLYTLNTKLSECLYAPLHMLEVSLRNRIHLVMSEASGDRWFDRPECQANRYQADMLAKATETLAAGKDAAPGAIVAALTFGFWTAMLGAEYENLWQTRLHRIAKRSDGKGLKRKDLSRPLTQIRLLRNRIAHHEPILAWNLRKHHDAILQLTGWLSPVAEEWCRDHSRFGEIFPEDGPSLARPGMDTATI